MKINDPPVIDQIKIQPETGIALDTVFTFKANNV